MEAVPGAADEGPHVFGLGGVRRHMHLHRCLVGQLRTQGRQRGARAQWHHQQVAVGPGPAHQGVVQGRELCAQRVPRQLAHHQHAQAAEGQQHARHVGPRGAVGVDVGGVDAHQRAVGQRHLDELHDGQGDAMALAADRQPLHAGAGGTGQAAQQAQRRAHAEVVQGDELRRVERELLLQRRRHVTGHEELDLVVGDAPADIVAALPQVGVAVVDDLGARREQVFAARDAGGVGPGAVFAATVHGMTSP